MTKMNLKEILISIGLTFLPFSELRISFFGIGELIFLYLFLVSQIKHNKIRKRNRFKKVFSEFWSFFISMLLIGFVINVVVFKRYENLDSVFFDFFAYLFVFIVIITLEKYLVNKMIDVLKICKLFFILSSSILILLYFISFSNSTLFGFTLTRFNHFQPFSTNVHHIAMFLSPLFFIGVFVLENTKHKISKTVILLFLVVIFFMIQSTNAFKANFGLFAGIIVYLYLLLFKAFDRKSRQTFHFVVFPIFFLFFLIHFDSISNYLVEVFIEEDVGSGRRSIYQLALNKIMISPFFGFGPGAQIYFNGEFWDAHQTLLTLLLQGGVFAFLSFAFLFLRIIKTVISSPSLFSCLIAISIYVLGGDILRRLPIWIVLVLIYYFAYKNKRKIRHNRSVMRTSEI
ncbi:MAG: hypothetical protein RB289_09545 [Paludibacter sp.]|jgi:O-antigen ligase|nr:hypothetical protein [Paludibacter sp.]